jgi:hypothetical protein
MTLAQTSLNINTLNLLWAFDYSPATDTEGNEIKPDIWDYQPVSFNLTFNG